MFKRIQKTSEETKSLLKAPWIRSSIKLGVVASVAGLCLLGLFKVFNVAGMPLFSNMGAFFSNYGLAGIFLITVAAGTLLPLGSPAFVMAAALFGVNYLLLILVASVGFTVGMLINYGLAYRFGRPYIQKRMEAEQVKEITSVWKRWGWPIYVIFGLIPVLPVELLSFICGLLKTRLSTFLILSFMPRLIVFTLLVYFGEQVGFWLGVG